jgi:fructose/tagatose bisphosphate aldolase
MVAERAMKGSLQEAIPTDLQLELHTHTGFYYEKVKTALVPAYLADAVTRYLSKPSSTPLVLHGASGSGLF